MRIRRLRPDRDFDCVRLCDQALDLREEIRARVISIDESLPGQSRNRCSSPLWEPLLATMVFHQRRQRQPKSIGAGLGVLMAGLILTACSSSSPASVGTAPTTTGSVQGLLQTVGGPAPGLPKPVSGNVVITNANGVQTGVSVGSSGRFTLHLTEGTYSLSGHLKDQQLTCIKQTIHVNPPSNIDVLITCPIR